MLNTPIITVDGPGGSGKSSLCLRLAQRLGWHALNSGALYRLLALAAQEAGVPATDEEGLVRLADRISVRFAANAAGDAWLIFLEKAEVTQLVQTDACGCLASQIASLPGVRTALLEKQRAFCQDPGLIAEGRDMGTVIFPEACLKIFLLASLHERAKRRYQQLNKGSSRVSLGSIERSLAERDTRDASRSAAPLVPAEDAVVLDTTLLAFNQVVLRVEEEIRKRFPSISFSDP